MKGKGFLNSIVLTTKKHSSEILIGIGIVGMCSSIVMAIKDTPKVLRLIEEKEEELEVDSLEPIDILKTVWKCYLPTAITFVCSSAVIISANVVQAKRHAAIAAAYELCEGAMREYKNKTIEVVGEKKEQTIMDAIAKDKVEEHPVPAEKREIIITGSGNTLCLDSISGRYFYSDIERIRKIENFLNKRLLDDMYITLNEVYYELGLDEIKIGDALGWDINKGLIELSFSSQLAQDDTPCLVIGYRNPPTYSGD